MDLDKYYEGEMDVDVSGDENNQPMRIQRMPLLLTQEERYHLEYKSGIEFICTWDDYRGEWKLKPANTITEETWIRDTYFNGEPKRQSYMERVCEALVRNKGNYGYQSTEPFILKVQNKIPYKLGKKEKNEIQDNFLKQALEKVRKIYPKNEVVNKACKTVFTHYRKNGLLYLNRIEDFQFFTDWERDLTKIIGEHKGRGGYRNLVKRIDSMISYTTSSELLFDECYVNYFKDSPHFYPQSKIMFEKLGTNPLIAHYFLASNYNKEKLDFSFPNKIELHSLFAFIEKELMNFFKILKADIITMRTALYTISERLQVPKHEEKQSYTYVILDNSKIEIAAFRNAIRIAVDACVDKIAVERTKLASAMINSCTH